MRLRGAVILVVDDRVALIRRERMGEVYYLFPGGGADPGETPEQAAVREAREELGLDVVIERLSAVTYRPKEEQFYFTTRATGGTFGTGTGEELGFSPDSPTGNYAPVFVSLNDLLALDVRPRSLAEALVDGRLGKLEEPLRIVD